MAEPTSIDSIIGRIQEEIGRRKSANGSTPPAAPAFVVRGAGPLPSPPELSVADQALARLVQTWRVGEELPPMHRQKGLKRRLAAMVGKLVLRLGQIFTREQREFNHATMAALEALTASVRSQSSRWDARLAQFEDALGKGRTYEELKHLAVATREELSAVGRRHSTALAQLRTSLSIQEGRLATLLDEARRRLPAPFDEPQLRKLSGEREAMNEALYSEFEAQFRGRWDDIKKRVSEYLPAIRAANAGTAARPVLDLGSGRGEWLVALRDDGLTARGVEISHAFVDKAKSIGLEVIEGDCLEELRKLPDQSLGAVTGLHIVEHLPFATLLSLLRESLRVLAPGGVVIFETPNCENLLVGACQFYLDPTHLRPLHPETLRFLVEAAGFSQVEIRRLHPVSEEHHFPNDGSALVQRLNHAFYGAQDYAIVAVRP
jgi:O-antigen chain-terminating methyltransferase